MEVYIHSRLLSLSLSLSSLLC